MDEHLNLRKLKSEIILLFTVFLFLFLIYKDLTVLLSILIILGTLCFNVLKRKKIKRIKKKISNEKKRLINLKYFHITDNDKVVDLKRRLRFFNLYTSLVMQAFLILFANILGIFYFIHEFFGPSFILSMVAIIALGASFFYISVLVITKFAYKFTTLTYVSVPVLSFVTYSLLSPFFVFFPGAIQFYIYLIITAVGYFIFIFTFPSHILRKLYSKTILASTFTTILITFFSQISEIYSLNSFFYENYLLLINNLEKSNALSSSLVYVLKDKELMGILKDYLLTTLAVSYLVGGLIVKFKIDRDNLKANIIYRARIVGNDSVAYQTLVECAFYGGREYENLLLNNTRILSIIMEKEGDLEIPDVSKKTRLKKWWKNQFIYTIYQSFKAGLRSH